MTKLLQINTSLFSTAGQSSRLADEFVAEWRAANPNGAVAVRDLAKDPVPHLTGERFQAFLAKPEDRTPAQQADAGISDALVEELKSADTIVIGLPMYNFGVPSTLKAYFDHVARAGITFRYTEKGPQGLLGGKRVYVFSTRGGVHAGTPRDSETTYVRDFLAFLGITEVEFIFAEGLAMGDATRKPAIDKATLAARQFAARKPELRVAA
ncbi:FMN-dependent NADH-azoreductase [Betaproteobacteria bacterium GR16-43]|nr:FMN-dependent NADH-azoreductase [Betaproteobacteria bacterium GR16-43]